MNLEFSNAKLEDLPKIMEIERAGFNASEASTEASMSERISLLSDTFIVAKLQKEIVGFVVGPAYNKRYIDDELYEKSLPNDDNDAYQTILSIAVDPKHHGKNIGSQLLNKMVEIAKNNNRKLVTLTCLSRLIPFYEKKWFCK
nr:GNAT family N-acetyltransferase [Apilactobacillus ozensis]